MESLVRRLGRILTPDRKNEEKVPSPCIFQRMERLEKALAMWLEKKGWRHPTRTIGEAAEELGTDTGTLFLYFDERIGMDFRSWRTRLRLEDACRLLLEEPETLASDIGLRVGFSNRSNFARQFRAHTGLTPAQWRKEARMSRDSRAPENDYA